MPSTYWTGASDHFHEGWYTWCTPDIVANTSNLKFASNEPSDTSSSENCIAATVGANLSTTFEDKNCQSPLKIICEVSEYGF
jgi:hypothetical protein